MFVLWNFQALQLGQDANTPFGHFNGQRCQMCLRSDPLLKVMERLSNPGESACCRLCLEKNDTLLTFWFGIPLFDNK
jgi:hypothetical protein